MQASIQYFFILIFQLLYIVHSCDLCNAYNNKAISEFNYDFIQKNGLVLSNIDPYKYIVYPQKKIHNEGHSINNYYKVSLENFSNIKNVYQKYRDDNMHFLYINYYNKIYNQWQIKLQNDSFHLLHIFYDKYVENFMNNKILYLSQIGLQNSVLKNTVIVGVGVRQICDNKRVIGYNTLFHIPLYNKNYLPYSMNIGGEFWYKKLIFSLNGYYNLVEFLNFNKLLYTNFILYPKLGYQIQLKIKLPYILECSSRIKWEQFFYNTKSNNNIMLNTIDDNQCFVSIGLQYRPIPIFEFNIDNTFANRKYINTLFKIAFNYQFNIPLNQQIYKKNYDNRESSFLNNLNIIMEPFIPQNNSAFINRSVNISKINRYPGDIKFIYVDNDKRLLKRYSKLLHVKDSKIIHIKNNIYAIYLPKTIDNISIDQENYTFVPEMVKDFSSCIDKTENMSVIEQNLISNNVDNDNDNDLSVTIDYEILPTNFTTSTVYRNNKSSNTVDIHDLENKYDDSFNDVNKTSIVLNTLYNEINHKTITNSDNNIVKIPPLPPNLPIFSQIDQSLSVSDSNLESSSSFLSDLNTSSLLKNSVVISSSSSHKKSIADANISKIGLDEKLNRSSMSTNSELNKSQDLFNQLSKQKKTKFSSVGTQDYIERLENSLLERKKDKKVTDIEKIFSKMHMTLSQSSIAESVETNDSIDSFSESSNF